MVCARNCVDGWHTTVAALVECTGFYLPPSFYPDAKNTFGCLFPCLKDVADALLGVATTMQIDMIEYV
jgi:hypothetical protein